MRKASTVGRPISLKDSSVAGKAPSDVGVYDRIMNTASELFYREGIQAVGIQRLIDEAGIAKASLYAHFASKDELVAAYLERRGAAWREKVEEKLADSRLSAREKILTMFDMIVELVEEPQFRGCPFQNVRGELAEQTRVLEGPGKAQRAWLNSLMARLVRETRIPSPDRVAGALIVLHDGAAATAMMDANPEPARHARWAAEQILAEVRT